MTAQPLTREAPPSPDATVGAGWSRRHYLLLVSIALLQMLIRAELPYGQDVLWGARSGLDTLHTGHLPHVDAYSWTAHGKAWIPNSWAWNVLLGIVYDGAGVIGFWLLGAVLAASMALLVGRCAERIGAKPLATAAVYVPLGLLGLIAVPRAQTVSTVVVLAIPLLVRRLLTADRRAALRAFGWLVLLQVVWINVHSAALIGPVVLVVCGVAILIRHRVDVPRGRALTRLLPGVAATALACVATPYGTAPLRHASEVRSASVGLVTEWEPVGFGGLPQILGLLAVIGGLGLAVRAWRADRPEWAAGIAVFTATTASAIRFLPMLTVVALPEAALAIGSLNVRVRMFRVMVAATCGVLTLFAVLNLRDLRSMGPSVSPRLVSALPSGCRLLNDDLVGDAVTLYRRDVPVSIDGRNDMYGRSIILKVEHLFEDKPGTSATLAADHVTCILGPTSTALVQRLRNDPAWSIKGTDALRTLLVRASGASS